mmetsp:Transcript_25709/g.85777  ORF Transcript_25709/g.85777 Transcript_25709/m.85777 type:complete len:204 (-) Transcript_25709:282-893(-)
MDRHWCARCAERIVKLCSQRRYTTHQVSHGLTCRDAQTACRLHRQVLPRGASCWGEAHPSSTCGHQDPSRGEDGLVLVPHSSVCSERAPGPSATLGCQSRVSTCTPRARASRHRCGPYTCRRCCTSSRPSSCRACSCRDQGWQTRNTLLLAVVRWSRNLLWGLAFPPGRPCSGPDPASSYPLRRSGCGQGIRSCIRGPFCTSH